MIKIIRKNNILSVLTLLSICCYPSYSQVIFSQNEQLEDNIDFLSKTKNLIRSNNFQDTESNYTDTDYIVNYEYRDFEKNLILLAAQSGVLDETVQKVHELSVYIQKDDLVMSIGRSPTIFMVLLNKIYPEINKASVAYSGTPDTLNIRSETDANNDYQRNIVTQENLIIYKNYISKYLENLKGNLYIVDHIGTGTSLNSFLRILRKLYPFLMKKIILVSLNIDPNNKYTDYRIVNNKKIPIFQYGPNSKKLSLAYIPFIGTQALTIDTIALNMSPRSLVMYDSPIVKQFFSPFGPFPACNWSTDYLNNKLSGPNKLYYHRHNFVKSIIELLYEEAVKNGKTIKEIGSKYNTIDPSLILTDINLVFIWGKHN